MDGVQSLPAELTIYSVGELYPLCLGWLKAAPAADDLQVQAHEVAEVDAAGIQLLLSLAKTLDSQGRALHLSAASACLVTACQALGAGHLLPASTAAETLS